MFRTHSSLIGGLRAAGLAVVFSFVIAGCDGETPSDGGTPLGDDGGGFDAGAATTDGGPTGTDAGPTGTDAGPTGTDGGPTGTDAGPTGTDAGPTGTDAGAGTDGGAPDTCGDGMRNGDETDVDCGGPTCPDRCAATEMCGGGSDCESAVCIGSECIAAACNDGIRNGDETDRDCGGPTCGGCANGQMCAGMDDCAEVTSMCTGGFCQPGSCADGMLNGAETALDCGGGTCAPCDDGDACALPRDCMSGICGPFDVCLPLECTNGIMDGTEIGVDCGGDCPACPDGTACTAPADCLSGLCDTVCISCNDELQNGDETDIDCGGLVCDGCSAGESCVNDSDCSFGDCLVTDLCDGPAVFYDEDFEGGDGGWTVGGTSPSWEYGTPAGTLIDAAASGTGAWVTNLTGDYNNSELSTLTSPVIDLSAAAEDPAIIFSLNYITEDFYDDGYLEVTTDGSTWTRVGEEGTGANWYNNSSDRWDNTSGGWVTASNTLAGTAGEATVQVRFVFDSDSSSVREGFGVDDVEIRAPIPNLTVAVAAIPDICGGVVVSVTNTGEVTIPSASFSYGINGSVTVDALTDVAPGTVVSEVLYASDGDTIAASVSGAADANPLDDAVSITFSTGSVPINGAAPYAEDFEASDGGWVSTGSNSVWEWGAPAQTIIDTADSGTSAWMTDLDADYPNSSNSLLVSPCFDASGASADLQISFALNFESEGCCDELTVDYSVDGGNNWMQVNAGTDWYNTSDGFAGSSSGWVTASATLPGTAGKPNVRVRFEADADSSSNDEGFAVDTIAILPGGMPDLQVTMETDGSCAAGEAVVENVGTARVSAYALTLIEDGVETRTTIIDPLDPGEVVRHALTGMRVLGATVEAPGDIDPTNNSAALMLVIPVTGGYAESFDADDGGFVGAGMNSTWAHGAPMGTFISGPASGVNAWVTNLTGRYGSFEFSTLTSPCFDFSMLSADPTISFSHIYDTEACCDHGWVEVSTDAGATWRKLGRTGDGTNWYDDPILDWWNGSSGSPGAWRTASRAMDGTAGASQVRFRFVVFTDGAVEGEGFGVDDIAITP